MSVNHQRIFVKDGDTLRVFAETSITVSEPTEAEKNETTAPAPQVKISLDPADRWALREALETILKLLQNEDFVKNVTEAGYQFNAPVLLQLIGDATGFKLPSNLIRGF